MQQELPGLTENFQENWPPEPFLVVITVGRRSFHEFQWREGCGEGSQAGEGLAGEEICLWAGTKESRSSSWDNSSPEDKRWEASLLGSKSCNPWALPPDLRSCISVVSVLVETFFCHPRTDVYCYGPSSGVSQGFPVLSPCFYCPHPRILSRDCVCIEIHLRRV